MRMSEEQWKRLVESGATFERIPPNSDKAVCKKIAEEGVKRLQERGLISDEATRKRVAEEDVKLFLARGLTAPTPKGKP